jgi:intracellular septation protein
MQKRALVHLGLEFLPVTGFYIVGQLSDFYTATAVLMILIVVSVSVGWWTEKRIPALPVLAGIFGLIGGSMTLWWQNPDALIFSDTLYYWSFASVLIIGLWRKVNLLQYIFASSFAITDAGWYKLTWRWIGLFIVAGLANEAVRIFLEPDDWIIFKPLKAFCIILFASYQLTLSRRYRLEEVSNAWGIRVK